MNNHVCPVWVGYLLINPLRKCFQDPEKIFGDYVKPGMNVIDFGCAMGYFSLPLARIVGDCGKVYCFDIQESMLAKIGKRASKAGLSCTIEPVLIDPMNNQVEEYANTADFTLLFAVAHEVPDRRKLFADLYIMMKNEGILLFAEPQGHVTDVSFNESVRFSEEAGFIQINSLYIRKSHSVLLKKQADCTGI